MCINAELTPQCCFDFTGSLEHGVGVHSGRVSKHFDLCQIFTAVINAVLCLTLWNDWELMVLWAPLEGS